MLFYLQRQLTRSMLFTSVLKQFTKREELCRADQTRNRCALNKNVRLCFVVLIRMLVANVHCQIASLTERRRTMRTAVPNLEMNRVEMCVEVLLRRELLATLLTSISYSSMCLLDMLSEITLLSVYLGANRARPSHFQMNSLYMKVKAWLGCKLQSTLITCTFLIHVNGFDVLIELGSFRK